MDISDWKEAGKIAGNSLQLGKKMIKPGVSFLEVAEAMEEYIHSKGAITAFPVNISTNDVAAHQCPIHEDPGMFTENHVIKLDNGACVNGAIGDTALSIDLTGKYGDLVKASRAGLNAALATVGVGVELGEVSAAIEKAIRATGFSPVVNLSGHKIEEYVLHAGQSVPAVATGDRTPIENNSSFAIEPFATDGRGMIHEGQGDCQIYMHTGKKARTRSQFARNILSSIEKYKGLPFNKRWIHMPGIEFGLRELTRANVLSAYPPLLEVSGGMVTQAEHTTVYFEDQVHVTTKVTDDEE